MKKPLLCLLMVLLLLTGCAADAPEPSQEPDETAAEASIKPDYLYDPESAAEAETGGAVRAYPLGDIQCVGLTAMGEDILLFAESAGTCLTRLTGEYGEVAATAGLTQSLEPASGAVQVTAQRVGYYDKSTGEIVLLDRQLAQVRRIALPEEVQGTPVLSSDMCTAYYSVDQEIRAVDLESGMSRLVKRQLVTSQTLLQSCFDGQVLTCLVTDTDDNCYTCFVSAETGETLGKDDIVWGVATYGDAYFLQRMDVDGTVSEQLFGHMGEEAQSLNLQDEEVIYPALEMGGVVTAVINEDGLALSFYDLDTGKRTAATALSGIGLPHASAVIGGYFWFAAYDAATGQQILYRWDTEQSQTEEETVYISPRYTRESPDLEGLAACQVLADEIGERYGVDILTGDAAVEKPCDYELWAEYQVKAFYNGMEALEQALARYPEGFFQTLCQGTDSGVLHIGLARRIANSLTGVQYWPDGDAYIVLAIGSTLEQSFYHEVSHVLDAYIIAQSLAYDHWETLNPKGFSYDYSYDQYMNRQSQDYLEGENRAFVDSYAMTYPKEDRARILEYAMLPDQEGLFQSEYLQKKLRQICVAIRDAFDWKKDSQVFPWEQYLEEPLAYLED